MAFLDKYKFIIKSKKKKTIDDMITEGITKNRQWLKDNNSVSGSKVGSKFISWFYGDQLIIKVGVQKLFKESIDIKGLDRNTVLDEFETAYKAGEFKKHTDAIDRVLKTREKNREETRQNALAKK